MRRLLLIGMLVGAIMALTVSSALAAKGVITEVNPSGHGIAHAKDGSGDRVDRGLAHRPQASHNSGGSIK